MKKVFLIFTSACFIISCNNSTSGSNEKTSSKDSSGGNTSNVSYAYKATYSSDFKAGDANNAKMVLDFFKMFEENRLNDAKNILADSVWAEFPDGSKLNVSKDSLIKLGTQERERWSSIKTTVDAFVPLHSNDKNEDWVLVWEKDVNTGKDGKVDSTAIHSYWQIKNNKIAGWSEFEQKMKPKEMTEKK